MGVEIDVRYEGDLHCSAVHGPSGQSLITDAPVDNGGRGEAFSPTDLVATALGSCLVTIMGIVAKREGLDISGTKIHVVKEMAPRPRRRIGALTANIVLPHASRLSDDDRRRLEAAAMACPVKESLHPEVKVSVNFVYPD
jgi:putative redox protein